jgi:nucleoid-associated protein YgaU
MERAAMTRETRIGLLVGVVLIVMFGLVLSEFAGPGAGKNPSAQATGNEEDAYAYNVLPAIPEAVVENTPATPTAAGTTDSNPAGTDLASVTPAPTSGIALAALVPPKDDADSVVSSTMSRAVAGSATGSTELALAGGTGDDVQVKGNVYVVKPGDNLIKIAREVYGQSHEKEYKKILDANRDVVRSELAIKVGDKLTIPPLPQAVKPAPASPSLARDVKPTSAAPTGTSTVASGTPAGKVGDATVASAGNVRVVSAKDLGKALGNGASGSSVAPATPAAAGNAVAVVKAGASASTKPAVGSSAGRTDVASAGKLVKSGKTYVVQPGDSLMKIARKTVKDDSKASIDKILAMNKDKVSSPQRLQVGTVLTIPG